MAAEGLDPRLIMADTSQGIVTSVSHRIAPQNSVAHAVNVLFDEVIGEAEVRPGSARLGSAAVSGTNDITGLFQFVDSAAGANSQILATTNGSTYYLSGTTWTETLSGDTAGLQTYFATFLDAVVRVNGTNAPKSWDGAGAWLTGGGPFDLDNMPTGKFVTIYKDQVIVLNTTSSPDTFEISSNPSGGAVSWTSGNRSITVNPDDGGNITGHGQIGGLLIIFKDDGMFRWNNRATEPDRIIDVGCSSHRSIASGGNLLFFFNPRGVWATNGGYPLRISRRVQKWINGMSSANHSTVSGFCDGEHYYCSIGDCTVDGVGYSNIVLKYSLQTKTWAVLSYATAPLMFAQYKSGNDVTLIYGDADSNVVTLNSGTTDFGGEAIDWSVESQQMDMGSRARMKEMRDRVVGFGTDLVDARASVRVDGRSLFSLGAMNGAVTDMRIRNPIKGKFFSFRVDGSSKTTQRFSGLELPSIAISAYGRA